MSCLGETRQAGRDIGLWGWLAWVISHRGHSGWRHVYRTQSGCRDSMAGTSSSPRRYIAGRIRLSFACASILLIGAVTGCTGSPSAPPDAAAGSPAGVLPATPQSSPARASGAATHAD